MNSHAPVEADYNEEDRWKPPVPDYYDHPLLSFAEMMELYHRWNLSQGRLTKKQEAALKGCEQSTWDVVSLAFFEYRCQVEEAMGDEQL